MNAESIGALIAQIRKEKNLTQKELAERLHISDKTVSKWETGRGAPDISSLEALSAVLGISVSELLAGKRFPPEQALKHSDRVLVKTLRRFRKLWLIFLLAAMGLLVISAAVFFGYHYFTTTDGENTKKIEALVADYAQNGIASQEKHGADFAICQMQEKANYRAYLFQNNGEYQICVFRRDRIFSSRWEVFGGTGRVESGTLSSYHTQTMFDPVLIVVFGGDLPEKATHYCVRTQGEIRSVAPIPADRQVLDIYLQLDSYDLGSPPILLDENFCSIDESAYSAEQTEFP
ncbi:MAG: helix-turn-helix domain-containing protein [Candidatus Fimenecus sp.]